MNNDLFTNSPPANSFVRAQNVDAKFSMKLMQSLNEKGGTHVAIWSEWICEPNELNWIIGKIYWAVAVIWVWYGLQCIVWTHIGSEKERERERVIRYTYCTTDRAPHLNYQCSIFNHRTYSVADSTVHGKHLLNGDRRPFIVFKFTNKLLFKSKNSILFSNS